MILIQTFEVCALTNNFISWIKGNFKVLEIAFQREEKRNFHTRLFSIVEPLLHNVPPTFLLPAQVMTPPPSPVQDPLVISEPTLKVRSVSGEKKTSISEEFILKALERLSAENSEVKERTSKLEGILGEILSRLPPPHKP